MYRFWQSWAILSVEGGDPGVLIRLPKSPLCTTSVRRILCADLWQHVTVFPDGCTYPCGGVSIEGLESGAMKSLNHSLYSKFRKTLIVRHTCFCMFTFLLQLLAGTFRFNGCHFLARRGTTWLRLGFCGSGFSLQTPGAVQGGTEWIQNPSCFQELSC